MKNAHHVFIIVLLSVSIVFALPATQSVQEVSAVAGSISDRRTVVNISNWCGWVYDNGITSNLPTGGQGAFYPKGSAGIIYQDGIVWGAKTDTSKSDGDIRVGGSTYNTGLVPGRVITGGLYEEQGFEIADPADSLVRIYRIRRDHEMLTHEQLIDDAADLNQIAPSAVTESMTQEIMDRYAADWLEWPGTWGAPYYDKDNDGIYTQGVDKPGLADADQVIWYVANDYDASSTMAMYGSYPMGVELQTTLWAYDQPGVHLMETVFKSYKITNTSGRDFIDMYVAQWSDPDIGSAANDLLGCDTVLNMGYAYNGESTDGDYDIFNLAPPAVGYVLLQGPREISDASDVAYMDFKSMDGYKNLPMTSFTWYATGSAIEDPELGEYIGTYQMYNSMRGYKPTSDIQNPVPWHIGNDATRPVTVFPMSGDPVTGTGDLDHDNLYFAPGDRRMSMASGPFYMAPGDTQEIIIALVGGLGIDNITSISDMRMTAAVAKKKYLQLIHPELVPVIDTVGIIEVVQLDSMNGNVVDDNLFLSLNYEGDGSQPWHHAAGAPRFYIDNTEHKLFGEQFEMVFDRFHVCGNSDFEIVFGDSSVAWSYLSYNVLNEKVPFAIYKYDPDGTVRRQFIAILDTEVEGTGGTWDQGIPSTYTFASGYEEIFTYDNSDAGYRVEDEAAYIAANNLQAEPSTTGWGSAGNPFVYPQLNRVIIAMYPDDETGMPANGTVIRFNTPKPVQSTSSTEDNLSFELGTAYPNPFNPQAVIPFTLDEDGYAELKVFDIRGNCVSTLLNGYMNAGSYKLTFNGSQFPSGVYIYRLMTDDRVMAGKMTLKK